MTNDIGRKLRILRKGRGLTQQQLAEQLGVSRATISNYEVLRRTPHINELHRFSEFYGVGLDYFGIAPQDEVFDLLSRAREVFNSPNVPKEEKEEVYRSLMKIYLEMQ